MKNIRYTRGRVHLSAEGIALVFIFVCAGYARQQDSVIIPDTNRTPGYTDISYGIHSITIEVEDIAGGREAVFRDMAASVLGLHPGDTVSDTLIRRRRASLENCGRFENVALERVPVSQGFRIVVRVKPFYYVKDMRLNDIWPLFTNEVLNGMSMHVGSPFSDALLSEQRDLVRGVYRREGIAVDSVVLSADRDEDDGNYVVNLTVRQRQEFHIDKVIPEGCGKMSKAECRYRLGGMGAVVPCVKGRRFVRKKYDNALRTILKKYREARFYDVELQDSIVIDSCAHKVTMHIRVNEGKRYSIKFKGNHSFSGRKLRKECMFESGNRNRRGIRKSRELLTEFYRRHGFGAVAVNHVVKDAGAKRVVTFTINEGIRARVNDLSITGNAMVSQKEIARQVLLGKGKPFTGTVLENDVEGILRLYRQKGFSDARVDTTVQRSDPEGSLVRVDVDFRIREGRRKVITSVKVESDSVLPEKELLNLVSLETGASFIIEKVYRNREALAAYIAEKGYPYCQAGVVLHYTPDSSGVAVLYTVKKETRVHMGHVFPVGNFKTAPVVLQREMLMERGETFSLRKTLESQRNVQNLPVFNSVQLKPVGLLERRDTIHFFLELEEKESLYLKLRTGFESGIGLFGEIKAGDKNLFGLNRHGWVSGLLYHSSGRIWRVGDIGWQTEAALLEPRLFGTRITASSKVSYERIIEDGLDFHADVTTASLALMRSFRRFFSIGTACNYELRKASGVESDTGFTSEDLREQFAYRNNLIVRPMLTFDTRDSFVRPRRGVYLGYSLELSRGIDNDIDDFNRNELIVKGFISPHPSLTLAVTGKWQSINDTTLSEDQRIFLGGTQDVRGYAENRLTSHGGNSAISGSLEARIGLPWKFELALFSDAGQVTTMNDPFDAAAYTLDEFKTTAGGGIRYHTPVGPVGILYGHRLNPAHYGAWHFSLGYSF